MSTGASAVTGVLPRRVIVHDHRALVREGVGELLRSSGINVVASVPTLVALGDALAESDADVVLSPAGASTIPGLTSRHRLVRLADDSDISEIVSEATRCIPTLDARRPGGREDPHVPQLTPRETGVLELVATGLTAQEIAGRLGISARTVENHKQSAFAKLGVNSQAQAVARALSEGHIDHASSTVASAS